MKYKFSRYMRYFAAFMLFAAIAVSASLSALGASATQGADILCFGQRFGSDSFLASRNSYAGLEVLCGGMPFGVKFSTDGVLIVGFCDVESGGKHCNPAKDAGLRARDIIKKIDGKALSDAQQLTDIIEKSDGKGVNITYLRNGEERTATLTPVFCESEGRYKTGIWVRDSGAGIGTVTFIIPETKHFGGLGHGICDSDTGELIGMKSGSVLDVTVSGLVRGQVGTPGEIKGYFKPGKIGTLLSNTSCGVYGVFDSIPATASGKTIKIGYRNEIKPGKATIRCTLDSGEMDEYEIEISDINIASNSSKCFAVKVTDKRLIDISGGIIQGMSGSPIIQNGKLVGAVTHVLINDPTTGYGIFIENMLNAANIPMAKAS